MAMNIRGEDRGPGRQMSGTVLALVDAGSWGVALVGAMALRFDFVFDSWSEWTPLTAIGVAIGAQVIAGSLSGLYAGRWLNGSLDEGLALARAVILSCGLLLVVNNLVLDSRLVPTSVVLAAAPGAFCGAGAARFLERLMVLRRGRRAPTGAVPVLILGAGDGGHRVISSMHSDPEGRYTPVGLIDDDPAKRNLRVGGVPVLGTRERLDEIAASSGARLIVVAAPSISSEDLRDVSTRALAADLDLRIVPHVTELIDGQVGADDVRPLTEADLLGRHQIDTDIHAIAGYITGRRVLVTGAGGSIGSELCRQLHRFGPESLIMVDRDESALHSLQMALEGRALLESERLVVADIRDAERMKDVFLHHRPDVVFHAAALKHLPLLEMHPGEAAKTNVWARSMCSRRRRSPVSTGSSTSPPTKPLTPRAYSATRSGSPSS